MAKQSSTSERVGGWAFIIGAVIALILGALTATAGQVWVIGLLLILGLIVGLLNVTDKEIVAFLVACLAFLVAAPVFSATLGGVVGGFALLESILNHIAVFVLPAALVASLKAILALAGTR